MPLLSSFSAACRSHRRSAARAQEVVRRHGIDVAEVLAATEHAFESYDREWLVRRLAQGPIICGDAHGPFADRGVADLPDSIGEFDADYAEFYGD